MATNEASKPLLDDTPAEETSKQKCYRYARYSGIFCLVAFAVCFVIAWILQGMLYAFATYGCSPSNLAGYNYPWGDGPEDHQLGYNTTNLVPRNEVLQYHDGWPSDSFDVTRATQFTSSGMGKVGTWYRYGGPIFNTYVFMDAPSGMPTVYIRQNLLRMGMSHRIARCDGKGPYVEFYEGMNWFINRIRHIPLFGWFMGKGTDYTFKISIDGKHIADALESVTSGIPSINFATLDHKFTFASGGQDKKSDQWFLQNDFSYDSNFKAQDVPYWVTSGSTMLFAFSKYRKEARAAKKHSASFLEMPGPSVSLAGVAAQPEADEIAAREAAETPTVPEVPVAEGAAAGGDVQQAMAEPVAQDREAVAHESEHFA